MGSPRGGRPIARVKLALDVPDREATDLGRAPGAGIGSRRGDRGLASLSGGRRAAAVRAALALHLDRGAAGAARDGGVPRRASERAGRTAVAPLRALDGDGGAFAERAGGGPRSRARLGAAGDRGRALLRRRARPRPPARTRSRLAPRAADSAERLRA